MRLIASAAVLAALLTPELAAARVTADQGEPLPIAGEAAEAEADRQPSTAEAATDRAPAQPAAEGQSDSSAPPPTMAQKPEERQTALTKSPASEFDGFGSASTARSEHGFTMGPNISNLGLGAELGYRFNDHFGLRLVGNYYADELSLETARSEYDADLTMLSAGAVMDIYPFGRSFRLTGGLRFNGNKADLDVRPTGGTGGQEVSLDGYVKFRKYAPYAGMGFQGTFAEGRLAMAADFGVFFQGVPDVHLEGRGPMASHPRFQAEVDREIESIENDLAIVAYYPVIRFSMTYRF